MISEPEVKLEGYLPYRIMPIEGTISGKEAAIKINEIINVLNAVMELTKITVRAERKK